MRLFLWSAPVFWTSIVLPFSPAPYGSALHSVFVPPLFSRVLREFSLGFPPSVASPRGGFPFSSRFMTAAVHFELSLEYNQIFFPRGECGVWSSWVERSPLLSVCLYLGTFFWDHGEAFEWPVAFWGSLFPSSPLIYVDVFYRDPHSQSQIRTVFPSFFPPFNFCRQWKGSSLLEIRTSLSTRQEEFCGPRFGFRTAFFSRPTPVGTASQFFP